jgi:hypothetical protein
MGEYAGKHAEEAALLTRLLANTLPDGLVAPQCSCARGCMCSHVRVHAYRLGKHITTVHQQGRCFGHSTNIPARAGQGAFFFIG